MSREVQNRPLWSLIGEWVVRVMLGLLGATLAWNGILVSSDIIFSILIPSPYGGGAMAINWWVPRLVFSSGIALFGLYYIGIGMFMKSLYERHPGLSKWGLCCIPALLLVIPVFDFIPTWQAHGLASAVLQLQKEDWGFYLLMILFFALVGILAHRVGRRYRRVKAEGEW